jgi:chromosome segregation ATPase
MEVEKSKFSSLAFFLPATLALSSACILFLTVNSASLNTLRSENDRETIRRAELSAALKLIREQLEPARAELVGINSERNRLNEERKSALEMISRAESFSRQIEQLKMDESALTRRLDELKRAQSEAADRLESTRGTQVAVERKISQASAEKSDAEARLAELSAKEAAASQRLAERERLVSTREKALAERDRTLVERESEIGTLSALIRRLEAQKRQLDSELAERGAEAKSITERIAGLERERINLSELQRLRSERTDLLTRLDGTRQELRTIEASVREKEAVRLELERAVGDLLAKRAAAEAALRKQ